MGLYIKNMEMPSCCADCDFHNLFSETPYCRRLLKFIPLEGRLKNCPLVEVPTPHGRLIDADELESKMIKTYRYFNVKFDLAEAETVIESEGN